AAVAEPGVESARRRTRAASILHRATTLLDSNDVERRVGKHLGNTQAGRLPIDRRRVPDLQYLPFPHADGAAAEQQRLGRLGRGVDEDRAGCLENSRQFGAQLLAKLVVEI